MNDEQSRLEPQGVWRRRVVAPILVQLRQGTSPREIALTLALGVVLGLFPVLGSTTLLCAVVAFTLRLNQPIIQLVNYLMTPAHLLLLFPFYRTGEWLFDSPPVPIVDIAGLIERFEAGPWQFLRDYGLVGLYGVVVWALLAPALALAVYAVSMRTLTTLASATSAGNLRSHSSRAIEHSTSDSDRS